MKASVSLAAITISLGSAAVLPACSAFDDLSNKQYGSGHGGNRGSDASADARTTAPQGGVNVAPGLSIQRVAAGLDYPTAIDFYEGMMVVTEAGHLPNLTPKVKTIDASGKVNTLLSATDLPTGALLGPLTDV